MEYLYSVFWKQYRIGYILKKDNKFIFTYDKEGLKESSVEGFDFLIGFPNVDEIYVNANLFPIFSYRLKTKERLKRDNISNINDLSFNNGKLITDNISIIKEENYTYVKRI